MSVAARVAAKLMASHCGHPGCTIGAHHAEVDHLDEWQRDNGPTDVANSNIRCRRHNPLKHRLGLIDRRTTTGQVITFRRDGTPMLPVGCRLPQFEPHHDTDLDHDDLDVDRDDLELSSIETRCRTLQRVVNDLQAQMTSTAA